MNWVYDAALSRNRKSRQLVGREAWGERRKIKEEVQKLPGSLPVPGSKPGFCLVFHEKSP